MSDLTMTCGELDARLADYLEGTLDAAERAAVEHHLAGCARCAGVLAALDARPDAAAGLPPLTPSRDLWSGVAERIGPRVLPLGERPVRRAPGRVRRIATLAVAASALVAATATITVMVVRPAPVPRMASGGNPALVAPAGGSTTQNASAHEAIIRTYDQEIAVLDSAVRLRQGQLDTATVRIIKKNLQVIDAAIAESRRALEKDPHNRYLNQQLARVLDQKVGLLRTAALLPSKT